MTLIVGLTGGIGCGKSTVSTLFAELGVPVIDTDVIAHSLTQADGAAMPAIIEQFGVNSANTDGSMNRPHMRTLVFNDPDAKQALERILHPLIFARVQLSIAQLTLAPWLLLVVPLLLKMSQYKALIQRLLVVDCDETQQISRTMARSQLDESMILAIMAQQSSRRERLTPADDIINNQADAVNLLKQVHALNHRYQMIASTYQSMSK